MSSNALRGRASLSITAMITLSISSKYRARPVFLVTISFAGAFDTDDCQATYEELKSRGVEFLSEPAQRPYGIEAVFKDNTGNWFSLTQHNGGS